MIGRSFWDIKPLYYLKPPKPSKAIACPICNSFIFWFKHARIFQRHPNELNPELREQYRIDIAVKCNDCGYVPFFGVHITKQEFEELRAIFIKNGIDNLMLEYKHIGHWLVSPVYKKREKR